MEYKVEKYNTTYEIYIYDKKGTPRSAIVQFCYEGLHFPYNEINVSLPPMSVRSAIVQFCYEGLHFPWDTINVSLPPMSVRSEGGDTLNINGLRILDDGSVYARISGDINFVAVGSFRKEFNMPEEGLKAVMEYLEEIQV